MRLFKKPKDFDQLLSAASPSSGWWRARILDTSLENPFSLTHISQLTSTGCWFALLTQHLALGQHPVGVHILASPASTISLITLT